MEGGWASLFDQFGPEWTLLALGPQAPDSAPFEAAAARLGIDLHVLRLPAASLRELYEAPLALIRPDQIVAWRGDDPARAAQVLARAVGRP